MNQASTLRALKDGGYRPRSVKAEIRANLLERLRLGEPAFPGILGFDETVLPQLESALLAGHDLVLLGERGQGKTRLMRTLVGLLDEWSAGRRGMRDQRRSRPTCVRAVSAARRGARRRRARLAGATATRGTSRSWPRRTRASATWSETSTR